MIFIYGTINYKKLADINRLKAFKHYVCAWKKQDLDTVKFDGETYSYTTRRGLVKKFKASKSVTPLKVNGFYFEEVKD